MRPTSTSRERITVLPATMPSAVATVRVKLGPCEYQCWNNIQMPMNSASSGTIQIAAAELRKSEPGFHLFLRSLTFAFSLL
jgi:hypothetical protein